MVAPFNLIEGVIWAIAFKLIYTLLQPILKNMKNKQHWVKASFALLIFCHSRVCDFAYPQQLPGFDSTIQFAIRGSACNTDGLSYCSMSWDTKIVVIRGSAVFAYEKWYSEALFSGEQSGIDGLWFFF